MLFISFTAPQDQRGHVPADDVVTLVPVVKVGLCRERLENPGDYGEVSSVLEGLSSRLRLALLCTKYLNSFILWSMESTSMLNFLKSKCCEGPRPERRQLLYLVG